MIIKQLSLSDFKHAFYKMGRNDQFSPEALSALYDEMENISEATGEPYELDVVALCCDYTEYDNIKEYHAQYYAETDEQKQDRMNARKYHQYINQR